MKRSFKRQAFRQAVTWICAWTCLSSQMMEAQLPAVAKPTGPILWRPYLPAHVSSTRMTNSERLHSLMRGGRLYLSLQDAIALAIENDLNMEASRNLTVNAEWAVERAQAGGAPRGVASGPSQGGAAAAGLGVLGTAASAGISAGGSSTSGGGGGGVTTSTIGTTAQVQDPFVQSQISYAHITYPQANQALSGTSLLVDTQRIYNTSIQQGLPTGGYVQLKSSDQFLNENSPNDLFNPASAAYMQLYTQIPVFRGRGLAVNTRQVKVAVNNRVTARETFRQQLESLVAAVATQYWDLVSANDTMKARQQAQAIAEKFYQDTRGQIDLGTMAPVELPRAAAELAARKQDLSIAVTQVRQQEATLKDRLTRAPDPDVEAAEIETLDRIQVPDEENIGALRELYATAMAKRPDMALAKIKDENAAISSLGTENALQPQGIFFAQDLNRGTAGTPHVVGNNVPNPYFAGGYGSALGQIFRDNFPSRYAGFYIGATIKNRQAQADYGVEQLQIKQSDVSGQRDRNAILVEISNEIIALRQARSRHTAAVESLRLQDQLLEAERNRFSFGTGTTSAVIVAQRAVVTAQTTLITALSAYAHARDSLNNALGQTLEVNHVSLDEGLNGQVSRESKVAAP
jgi:outer membrane protein